MTVPIFFGTSYVAAKIGMQELLPLNLVILRFVIASLIFTFILLLKKGTSGTDKKDIPQFYRAYMLPCRIRINWQITLYFIFAKNKCWDKPAFASYPNIYNRNFLNLLISLIQYLREHFLLP